MTPVPAPAFLGYPAPLPTVTPTVGLVFGVAWAPSAVGGLQPARASVVGKSGSYNPLLARPPGFLGLRVPACKSAGRQGPADY